MTSLLQLDGRWLLFRDPVEVLVAYTHDEVRSVLRRISDTGCWTVGWISYEAAGAFDSALTTHPSCGVPLVCFGSYAHPVEVAGPGSLFTGEEGIARERRYEIGDWTPSVGPDHYRQVIGKIRDRIAAGETYQVNYTFHLRAAFRGDPRGLFLEMTRLQPGGCGAYIEYGDTAVCCASPEMFFTLHGGEVTSRPMKGTRARGLSAEADRSAADALRTSEKDRAENIMITDMIRNDIGRVAEPGTVETVRPFDIEGYPTVWQMTSTVKGRIGQAKRGDGAAVRVLEALFPCASITGAPKVNTMRIIRELENGPRGIYTGSIGVIAPDGDAQFNVAIRTAVIDRRKGRIEYGTGGGIIWDSEAESEYAEALHKASILTRPFPPFQCLETMRYDPGKGIFLLDRHVRRLGATAERFGFALDADAVRGRLEEVCGERPLRVRLLLNAEGGIDVQTADLEEARDALVALAREPVDSSDLFLYHKTTHRAVYEQAVAGCPGVDDVILYNERGELTESCTANLVLKIDGRYITPAVECGLLAGTYRDELLARQELAEGILQLDDLGRADEIWLINSVRLWRRAVKQGGQSGGQR